MNFIFPPKSAYLEKNSGALTNVFETIAILDNSIF